VRRWQGVFLHLIAGLLGILVGFLIVTHLIAGALAWTPLFAAFFTVLGFFGWWELSFSSFPRGPGRLRRNHRDSAPLSYIGGMAVVRLLVSGHRARHLLSDAWLVLCHVGAGPSKSTAFGPRCHLASSAESQEKSCAAGAA
jgi:hypothetical protein